jgi:hypothetical protein
MWLILELKLFEFEYLKNTAIKINNQSLEVSETVFFVKYLVAIKTVPQKTVNIIEAIIKIKVRSKPGVLSIKNYSICIEKPKLKTIPSKIPLTIATNSLISTSKNIIILISVTLKPTALNILYISASSFVLFKV